MDYNSTILSIIDLFNRNSVQYLIVGGTAVAYYGKYRKSTNSSGEVVDKPDLDIWYNPNYTNYFNLLNALEALGKDVKRYKAEIAPNPKKSVFRYEFDDYTFDIIPAIGAL